MHRFFMLGFEAIELNLLRMRAIPKQTCIHKVQHQNRVVASQRCVVGLSNCTDKFVNVIRHYSTVAVSTCANNWRCTIFNRWRVTIVRVVAANASSKVNRTCNISLKSWLYGFADHSNSEPKRPECTFSYFNGGVSVNNYVEPRTFLISWSGTPGTSFGAFIWDGTPGALNQHINKCMIFGDEISKQYVRLAVNSCMEHLTKTRKVGLV